MLNSVNANSPTPWANVNRKIGTGQQSTGPNRTLKETVSDLTDRESEILARIREMVGSPVKFNMGDYTCNDRGLTLFMVGFDGVGASGYRPPFMITRDMLREMADDESVYHDRMEWVREALQHQSERERVFNEARLIIEQDEAERRAQQMRARIQEVTDSIWADDSRNNLSSLQSRQAQSARQAIAQYEQNLAY